MLRAEMPLPRKGHFCFSSHQDLSKELPMMTMNTWFTLLLLLATATCFLIFLFISIVFKNKKLSDDVSKTDMIIPKELSTEDKNREEVPHAILITLICLIILVLLLGCLYLFSVLLKLP